jgi:hypothetical protein
MTTWTIRAPRRRIKAVGWSLAVAATVFKKSS